MSSAVSEIAVDSLSHDRVNSQSEVTAINRMTIRHPEWARWSDASRDQGTLGPTTHGSEERLTAHQLRVSVRKTVKAANRWQPHSIPVKLRCSRPTPGSGYPASKSPANDEPSGNR